MAPFPVHLWTGLGIWRGTPALVAVPVAILSHPVLDRVFADFSEQPWEYAIGVPLSVGALYAGYKLKCLMGVILASFPDVECFLHAVFGTPQPLHDIWWKTAWQDTQWATQLMEYGLLAVIVLTVLHGHPEWKNLKERISRLVQKQHGTLS